MRMRPMAFRKLSLVGPSASVLYLGQIQLLPCVSSTITRSYARRCCTSCGQVLDETTFSAEVTFSKGAGGISTADGQFVSDVAASRGLGRISGGKSYGYQVMYPIRRVKLFFTSNIAIRLPPHQGIGNEHPDEDFHCRLTLMSGP